MFWTNEAREKSKIESRLKNINRRSRGKRSLKFGKKPGIARRASQVGLDGAGVLRNLKQVGNGFVRYRDQQRSFSRRGLFRVIDREMKAGILRE